MNYNLERLRRFLTTQEDAEGGAINFIFKKRAPTENPRICPRHAEMPPQTHLASFDYMNCASRWYIIANGGCCDNSTP